MELRHLRYFVAVAEAENVSRAALKLHVSQPGLSRQIRDLEDELGFALFKRDGKSVRLTEAGRAFQGEARAVLERVEEALKTARAAAAGAGGELHIGYAPSLTVRLLPPALRAFQSGPPRARALLHDLSTEEMLAGLRDGALQIAFLARPPRAALRGLRFEELLRDNLCLAVPPNHPLARRRTVSVAELAHEPLIAYSRKEYPEYHDSLAELFATVKSKPQIAEEHDGITSLIAAVEAGGGVALVTESVVCLTGPRLKLIPLVPAPEPIVIGAAWPARGLAPAAKRFLDLVVGGGLVKGVSNPGP
jgi:DNA-binding transcriptional LysR family regulator